MNVVSKVTVVGDTAQVRHAVNAYDRRTDALVVEHLIPPQLDASALRVAGIPADDPTGAVSYRLTTGQIKAFTSLLGFGPDLVACEYFFEASDGAVAG